MAGYPVIDFRQSTIAFGAVIESGMGDLNYPKPP
jgi:hypothetical protein